MPQRVECYDHILQILLLSQVDQAGAGCSKPGLMVRSTPLRIQFTLDAITFTSIYFWYDSMKFLVYESALEITYGQYSENRGLSFHHIEHIDSQHHDMTPITFTLRNNSHLYSPVIILPNSRKTPEDLRNALTTYVLQMPSPTTTLTNETSTRIRASSLRPATAPSHRKQRWNAIQHTLSPYAFTRTRSTAFIAVMFISIWQKRCGIWYTGSGMNVRLFGVWRFSSDCLVTFQCLCLYWFFGRGCGIW